MNNCDWDNIIQELINSINIHPGVNCFIQNRSSFENWIQIELVGLLLDTFGFKDIKVEDYNNYNCDIIAGNIGIELKIFISGKNSYNKINSDIEKLKNNNKLKEKYVFVVGINLANSMWDKMFSNGKFKSKHNNKIVSHSVFGLDNKMCVLSI